MLFRSLVHGEACLEGAKRISRALFSNEIESLTRSDFEQLALDGLPVTKLESEENLLLDALVASELAVTPRGEVTRGQARKLVLSNAISINGEKQTDEHASLSPDLARHGRYFLVKKGKKQHHLFVSP